MGGKVVVDEIDEEMRVVDVLDEAVRFLVGVVQTSPSLQPKGKRLVLPNPKERRDV